MPQRLIPWLIMANVMASPAWAERPSDDLNRNPATPTRSAETSATQDEDEPLIEPVPPKALDSRRIDESIAEENPSAFTTFRANYLLPVTYSHRLSEQDYPDFEDHGLQHTEAKFQLSFKFKVLDKALPWDGSLYFAYTQRSWWQVYNAAASRPFRETNYQPEAFASFSNNMTFLGWTNRENRFGFAHQSNGRGDPLSRSWNYLYVDSIWGRGNWALSLAPRWRLPESDEDDDNPDLARYKGYMDVGLTYAHDQNEYSLSVFGNPKYNNYGGTLEWSFPLQRKLRGFVQIAAGYGESLIDYDLENYRLGFGIQFSSLLGH